MILQGCSSDSTAPSDIQAPTPPSAVRTVVQSSRNILLSWASSTDNVGVAGYRIYRNDVYHTAAQGNSIALTELTPAATHCFKITAVDAAGNESEASLNTCTNTAALNLAGEDPTANWAEFARYGDFLSAQMKSLRKFGYGIFIVKMQAADGPVCSTFWLYSDAPAPGVMPEIRQMWRWNEFDIEFVPYTVAKQNSYMTLAGSFPNPTVKHFGAKITDWESFETQKLSPQAISWQEDWFLTDDTIAADMQHFYNRWMIPDTLNQYRLAETDFNFEGLKRTTGAPHQTGWTGNPKGKSPGWSFAMDWKYPLTAISPVPAGLDMKKMAAINWWRTPLGNQSINVDLTGYTRQTFNYIVREGVIKGSTAASSNDTAALNNESYVFPDPLRPGLVYSPYVGLNTYTIVWTKTRVAFYINAGSDGRNIAGATPIAVFTADKYPSISGSGTQAAQGNITWADTSLTDALGKVSINLANYVAFKGAKNIPLDSITKKPLCQALQTCSTNANLPEDQKAGDGWSGYPPGSSWTGADAYFRSVQYYPLTDENNSGTQNSHFDFSSADKWVFDLSDGTWTAANFRQKISQYFGILYAQDYTKDDITYKVLANGLDFQILTGTLRDSKSPMAVSFFANADGAVAPDGLPLLRLNARPSVASPARNFFFVTTKTDTGKPISDANPFIFATIDTDGTGVALLGISGASTPMSFFAPPAGTSVHATIKVYSSTTYKGSFPPGHVPVVPTSQGIIKLESAAYGAISWSFVSGDDVVEAYQSANPHLITIKTP
jgi:hypothetical protein